MPESEWQDANGVSGQDVKEEKIWRNTRHTNTVTVACGFWQRAIYFLVVESGR